MNFYLLYYRVERAISGSGLITNKLLGLNLGNSGLGKYNVCGVPIMRINRKFQ